ncbi:MAG: glycerophosphodiester phosphodiesterase family protein [Thermomicrobiales bacterium]
MRNIAHRGASAYAPENTASAFDLAISMQADAIETDVQCTRDGYLILFHDTLLDRSSDGSGPVTDMTLEQIRQLDIGLWFDKRFTGARILTLQEALVGYLDRIPIVLEIKDSNAAGPMMDMIPVSERLEVTSFDWDALILARSLAPTFRFGFLTPQFDEAEIDRCVAANLQQICPHADSVTQDLVVAAHRRGLDVRAWGISTRQQIDRLRAANVDGTTCNWPDWLS